MPDSGDNISIQIRSFHCNDLDACQNLFTDGLIGGKIAQNDTGIDIDDIEAAYMNAPGGHFWVATLESGEIIGMIGVQQNELSTGEIRRLRVAQKYQRRGIGSRLLETALAFCQDSGYVKVALDTFVHHEPAIKLFEKFNFRHTRSRMVAGKELKYFYLDLYSGEKK